MNITFDRACRAVSSTQHFIAGTLDWANSFEKKLESVTNFLFHGKNASFHSYFDYIFINQNFHEKMKFIY